MHCFMSFPFCFIFLSNMYVSQILKNLKCLFIYSKWLHFDQSKQPQSLWQDVRWLLCAIKVFVRLAFMSQYGSASTRHKEYRYIKAVPSRKTNIPHTWTTHTLSYLCDCLYRRSVLQKELHHFQSVFLTGDVEGSKTILRHYKRENTCVQKV